VDRIRTFEELECWKACRRLRVFVARWVVPLLPREEKYRMGDQMIRAARSTTANLAEGYGRFHYLDNAKFVSNARGFCWEVLDPLIAARDESLIDDDVLARARHHVDEAIRLLNGYLKYLKSAAARS
jgi:four helix bundle protein